MLESLAELRTGRLITIFGCGGDRDKGKRPMMGEVVARYSDIAVVTSDNPRSEDPKAIIEDIMPGLDDKKAKIGFRWESYVDRKEAIGAALDLAQAGDVILVAGKGHEDYQEVQGERRFFLDSMVCRELMAEKECSNYALPFVISAA